MKAANSTCLIEGGGEGYLAVAVKVTSCVCCHPVEIFRTCMDTVDYFKALTDRVVFLTRSHPFTEFVLIKHLHGEAPLVIFFPLR